MIYKRIHHSKNPIKHYQSAKQNNLHHIKPKGLWYSFGDQWINHDASTRSYNYKYEVSLLSKNILLITNKTDLESFLKRPFFMSGHIPVHPDWELLSEEFDGIEINPYIQYPDLDLFKTIWYYCWDVPGGCLWGENACHLELESETC